MKETNQKEVPCKTHPDAPHGFLRNASHNEGRYVCECEHWEPEEKRVEYTWRQRFYDKI